MDIKVDGMMCSGCAATVEKAIKTVDPAAAVKVDLPSGMVSVDTQAEKAAITQAIEAAGYDIAA